MTTLIPPPCSVLGHKIGTWSETTYGDWGSQTITVRSCLRRDCDWRETEVRR